MVQQPIATQPPVVTGPIYASILMPGLYATDGYVSSAGLLLIDVTPKTASQHGGAVHPSPFGV